MLDEADVLYADDDFAAAWDELRGVPPSHRPPPNTPTHPRHTCWVPMREPCASHARAMREPCASHARAGALPPRAAVAFVTATLTPAAQKAIEAQFPLVERRRGRGLHRTAQGVAEKLIDCSAGGASSGGPDGFELKMGALLSELQESCEGHTLIFCNTIEARRRLASAPRAARRAPRAARRTATPTLLSPPHPHTFPPATHASLRPDHYIPLGVSPR